MGSTLLSTRRVFLKGSALAALGAVTGAACAGRSPRLVSDLRRGQLLFTTQGRTAFIRADGGGLRYLEVQAPNQVTWQPAGFFSDGRRILMLSMETRRDGPGKPFDVYYTQTPTHLWSFDLVSGALVELATRDRLAVFYTPQLLIDDHRMLVQVVKDRVGQVYNMNVDGSDARPFTQADEGLPYGFSAHPVGSRIAFHLASPQGYQIWTSDAFGGDRRQLAGKSGHLYFGPMWSRDGEWVAFQDCVPGSDPGHDRARVWVCRPDGSGLKLVTGDGEMWFAATYGGLGTRGGGSNVVSWSRDGALLLPMLLPGSRVPWEYQVNRPDTDHFNREFKPAEARGGCQICRVNPATGRVDALTPAAEGVWDFRCSESPDGRSVVFCRARTGGAPLLWVMDADGTRPTVLSAGWEGQGADHPRWMPDQVQ